jgi:hypothetical protein
MAEIKTKATKVSVKDFIANVPNETRRADAQALLKLFEKVTGWKAQMWGPTIVGFGSYAYTYDSGHTGKMCAIGFSPRSTNLVIYSGVDPTEAAQLLKALGKHKISKACIYINKLADVDMAALEKVVKAGLTATKKLCQEKGWPVAAT